MKKHISILFRIFGYYALYLLLVNVSLFVILLVLHFTGITNVPEVTGEFISDVAAIPFLILFFHLYSKERRAQLFSQKLSINKLLRLIPISIAARLAVVAVMAVLVGLLILFFGKDIGNIIDQGVAFQWTGFDHAKGWDKLFGFLSFVIFGPINEEILNRAVILEYLRKHYSDTISIVYSSVIFMFAHLHPGLYASSFILGVCLALVYVKWKNIWYAVILHMLINLQPFLFAYFIDKI